jgi:hypothetical protein
MKVIEFLLMHNIRQCTEEILQQERWLSKSENVEVYEGPN